MIHLLPFKHVRAFADLNDGLIFVRDDLRNDVMLETLKHEIAHIQSGQPDHNDVWRECNKLLGGNDSDDLARWRKKAGIPDHIAGNIGNISGIQNMLLDYHMLMAYRKFSQRILGTEGQWEFKYSTNTVRLFPTPKGTFPVIMQYVPIVESFNSPQAREITYRIILAQMKIALGHARRKIGQVPSPDGGTIGLDGDQLVSEGKEEYEAALQEALHQGEPLRIYLA